MTRRECHSPLFALCPPYRHFERSREILPARRLSCRMALLLDMIPDVPCNAAGLPFFPPYLTLPLSLLPWRSLGFARDDEAEMPLPTYCAMSFPPYRHFERSREILPARRFSYRMALSFCMIPDFPCNAAGLPFFPPYLTLPLSLLPWRSTGFALDDEMGNALSQLAYSRFEEIVPLRGTLSRAFGAPLLQGAAPLARNALVTQGMKKDEADAKSVCLILFHSLGPYPASDTRTPFPSSLAPSFGRGGRA